MAMPTDLILVRHGESEGNVAVKASKAGDDIHVLNEEFRARHSSWWRLTDRGVQQAQTAGAWIRENIGAHYDRYYTSAYMRAMETAGNLGLPDARWFVDPNLRERERGREDLLSSAERALQIESIRERESTPLYWKPLNGESIADTCTRVRDLCETLHREVAHGRAIVVCHGEVMESFRLVLERLTPYAFAEWTQSEDPADRIHNGQVFHYSNRGPDGSELPYYGWFRSVNTCDPQSGDPSWRQIQRPVFDNQGLLDLVNRTPRIIS